MVRFRSFGERVGRGEVEFWVVREWCCFKVEGGVFLVGWERVGFSLCVRVGESNCGSFVVEFWWWILLD